MHPGSMPIAGNPIAQHIGSDLNEVKVAVCNMQYFQ